MLLKHIHQHVTRRIAAKRTNGLRQLETARLSQHFPLLPRGRSDARLKAIEAEYAPFHDTYVAEVSTARAAVSLEQAALLAYLVRTCEFRSVMDSGSGFSSFVLRRESQRKGGIVHVSVEDADF
jgi:hypothetical protein